MVANWRKGVLMAPDRSISLIVGPVQDRTAVHPEARMALQELGFEPLGTSGTLEF